MYHILMIGAGVSGLTTAWALLEKVGYSVTILAANYASNDPTKKITSQIASALWEWPPLVCGKIWYWNERHMEMVRRRCMVSFHRFKEIAENPETRDAVGVKMRTSNFFFTKPIKSCPVQTKKMHEIKTNLPEFRHDSSIIQELGISTDYGVIDSYSHLAPVIDTDKYMEWLFNKLKSRGVKFVTRKLDGTLFKQEAQLLLEYNADIIVNATGLNAKALAKDSTVFALRGALFRVVNDGSCFPKINEAMCVSLDGENTKDMVYLVPRNYQILLVGGIGEPNKWDTDEEQNYAPFQQMLQRNFRFLPALAKGQLDKEYPLAIGICPFRYDHVRVGREGQIGSRIVHNYGHGDGGFTLSYGCAEDTVEIVEALSEEIREERMMASRFAQL